MTRKTVAKTKKSGQRRTEKPVDSEIRRAAKRAGIKARVPLETLKTALREIVDEGAAKRLADELQAQTAGAAPRDTIPSPPPDPIHGLADSPRIRLDDRFRDSLSSLLTGSLWTHRAENGDAGGGAYAAMLHLAAVQAKILAIAVANHDSGMDTEFGRSDWALDETDLTTADVVTALHALASFLRDGRDVLSTMDIYGEFRHSTERQAFIEEQAAKAERAAKAGAA